MSLNSDEAMKKIESLFADPVVNSKSLANFMNLATYFGSSYSCSYADAMKRAEEFALKHSLSAVEVDQVKGFYHWLDSQFYISSEEAFKRTLSLYLSAGMNEETVKLYQECRKWLEGEAGLYSDSFDKADLYFKVYSMKRPQFESLKTEFQRRYQGTYSRSRSLEEAEKVVFHLSAGVVASVGVR
jgi:hypothetical protein